MELSQSYAFNEEQASEKLQILLQEARQRLAPRNLSIRLSEDIPLGSNAHTFENEQKNHIISVRTSALNEGVLSHEILHFMARTRVPRLIRVMKFDLVGIIGTELQGYLEHRWIRAEQVRRAILTAEAELELFPNLLEGLGPDEPELGENIQRILFLNNLIDTYPAVFEKYQDHFVRRNPQSLRWAERIMAHYPKKTIKSYSEARSCTVGAIREWEILFLECGLDPNLLRYLLSVVPAFTRTQLEIPAQMLLGLLPEAIQVNPTKEISSVIYALDDGQGCALLTLKQEERDLVIRYFSNTTLGDFLKLVKIPYLVLKKQP